jgi:DNA-3-methyladenine glycosylase
MILTQEFYQQDTITIAQKLLGTYLVNDSLDGKTVGKIVETEAYVSNDPANHAFKGQSVRNTAMFRLPGHVYIYLIYGKYYCFNVVTEQEGVGEAVLIRALEPTEGINLMQIRRKTDEIRKLCSGPGKLVQAMAIPKYLNGNPLSKPPLYIEDRADQQISELDIVTTTRVGISKGADAPLRFYLKDNPFISKK